VLNVGHLFKKEDRNIHNVIIIWGTHNSRDIPMPCAVFSLCIASFQTVLIQDTLVQTAVKVTLNVLTECVSVLLARWKSKTTVVSFVLLNNNIYII